MGLMPGIGGQKTELYDGVKVDTLNEYTIGNGVSQQGRTNGVAIGSGLVGQYTTTTGSNLSGMVSGSLYQAHVLSVPAGIWLIWGYGNFVISSGDATTNKFCNLAISTTSANMEEYNMTGASTVGVGTVGGFRLKLPQVYFNLASTTSVYLNAQCNHITGTAATVNLNIPTLFAVRIG